ncbi:MAG: YIP1 family protein [Deltaproteobacteria bacterium]|nr:YIP1 family protein [Deltaproteobacteria bacterium]
MTSSRQRILEMVAKGEVSAEEAEQLLAAVGGKQPSRWRVLVDPFERLGMAFGLGMAALSAIASLALITLNVRYDGALDLHVTAGAVSLAQGLVDQLVAWFGTSLVLWIAALVVGRRGRVIDFVVVVGVARLPMVLGGVASGLLLADFSQLTTKLKTQPLPPELLLTLVVVLPCLAWFVTLLYYGFKTASGLKGARLVAGFVGAIVIAELASKVLLSLLRSVVSS